MRALMVLVMLVLVGCARRADLGPELHVLGTMEDVGAAAYSASGERHPFHELAHAILYEGTSEDFERLVKDPRPVSRCMGLYLLARSGSPRAEAILVRQMSEPGPVEVYIGCVGDSTTVGGFARRLLRDRNYLEFVMERSPIWSPEEMLADDVRLLAYDGAPLRPAAAAAWAEADGSGGSGLFGQRSGDEDHLVDPGGEDRAELKPGESIRAQLDAGAVSLDARTIADLCRGLPRWRVVKALGRAGPHPAVRRFLLERLADDDERQRTRLVAASALTRDPSPEAFAALQSYAEPVGRWACDPAAGGELLRQWQHRADVDAMLRENTAHQAWERDVAGADASGTEDELAPAGAERAFDTLEAAADPVVLDWHARVMRAFEDDCNDSSDDRELEWDLRASAKLRRHRAPWDTYSDAVHALTGSGSFVDGGGLFGDVEEDDEPRGLQLKANVREALRALDREPP